MSEYENQVPEQEAVAEVTDLGGGLYYGVKLLNGPKECLNPLIKPGDKLYTHPSAKIERLRAENKRLKDAFERALKLLGPSRGIGGKSVDEIEVKYANYGESGPACAADSVHPDDEGMARIFAIVAQPAEVKS